MTNYGPGRLTTTTYPAPGPCTKHGNFSDCTQDQPCPPCTECQKDALGHYIVPNTPVGCQTAPCPPCTQCNPDCADPIVNKDTAPKRRRDQAPSQVIDLP